MQCASCGAQNRSEARFCGACGGDLSGCPSCGVAQPAGARFCDACGEALHLTEAPDRSEQADARGAPPAERRSVSVLFADAKGSTALTERIGDEKMYRLMQRCVTLMQDVVDRHGGTVTQFRGDGVMALFGAPRAIEQAATAAVSAALEIQDGLRHQSEELGGHEATGCEFRVGVNTGPVVVGRVGDDTLVDYTAIGDTANVAARMEQSAGAGEVYLSEATWRAVRDDIDCDPVGSLELDGKSEPVRTFRAVGRLDPLDSFDVAEAQGFSPFVGRQSEVAMLEGLVEAISDNQGRVVLISGEAGIGKSRLVREAAAAVPDDYVVFTGRSSSADRRAPWHLIADLLRQAFAITDDQTPAVVGRVVDEASADWAPEAREAAPYLKWLLGLELPELADLDPDDRRAGVFEALVAAVADVASRQPLVLIVEDLHWADEASLAAVRVLAQSIRTLPVLIVATARPDGAPDLGAWAWSSVLALDALTDVDAEALAASAAGRSLSTTASALVVERCGGNPLFVEELTAALLESGVFAVGDDAVEVSTDSSEIELPSNLHDVVHTRIDRLDGDARAALQLASVIGREFTRRLLDRITAQPIGLDEHLSELESLELIRQQSWFPELAYLFKHAVVHEVTYSTLLEERRRSLHEVVATATEELYADQVAEHAEALTRHWLAAGNEDRALPHIVEAAGRAMAGSSMDRAQELFAMAAEIAEASGDIDTAIAHRLARIDALMGGNRFADVLPVADETLELARSIGAADHQAWTHARRSNALLSLHEFDDCKHDARLAEQYGRVADVDAALFGLTGLYAVHGVLGEQPQMEPIAERARSILGDASPGARAAWFSIDAIVTNWRGAWDEAVADAAVSPPPAIAHERANSQWIVGLHRAGMGDYLAALEILETALVEARRMGFGFVHSRVLNTLAWVHSDLADSSAAIRLNRESLALALDIDHPDSEVEANARLNLADDALRSADLDEAQAQVDALAELIHHPTYHQQFCHWRFSMRWWCVRSGIELRRGDPRAALEAARRSFMGAEATNSAKYLVRARRHIGQALLAAGDDAQARHELAASVALAEDIGNPPQLWRSLTALAELGDLAAARRAIDVIDGVIKALGDHPLARSLADGAERRVADRLARG